MSCESDNVGICVFSVNLFLEFESSDQPVIMCIKERGKADTPKAAAKSSLMEIKTFFLRDVASKFELSFNKFSFSLVALTDATGAFKFSRQ